MANTIHVTIENNSPSLRGAPLDIQARSVAMALTIAEINADSGRAEIWDGDRRLATLKRRGDGRASYWEVR